jgi:hypothetical protein
MEGTESSAGCPKHIVHSSAYDPLCNSICHDHQFQHITQIMAGKTWEAKLSDQLAEQLLNFKRADWVDGFVLGIRP